MAKKKPSTVPAAAMWNASDNEWELKSRNSMGVITETKWWLAPTGHLCCHTFFGSSGEMLRAKRYHPNGEVSLDLSFDDNGNEVSVYFHSTDETNEYFPSGRFKKEWSAKRRVGSFPKEYDYYDKDGNLLTIHNVSSLKKMCSGKNGETAEQAIKRFDRFLSVLQSTQGLDEESIDEITGEYQPYCIKKVTHKN